MPVLLVSDKPSNQGSSLDSIAPTLQHKCQNTVATPRSKLLIYGIYLVSNMCLFVDTYGGGKFMWGDSAEFLEVGLSTIIVG